nr:uncharacterized protein LOC115122278 [Oncorhynchus nerka]
MTNASTSPVHPKFWSLTRGDNVVGVGSSSQRGIADGGTTTTPPRKSPRANPTHHDRSGCPTAESSPYFTRRRQGNKPPAPKPYHRCMQLPWSDPEVRMDSLDSVDRAVVPGSGGLGERGAAAGSSGQASPRSVIGAPTDSTEAQDSHTGLPLHLPLQPGPASPRMEWKVIDEVMQNMAPTETQKHHILINLGTSDERCPLVSGRVVASPDTHTTVLMRLIGLDLELVVLPVPVLLLPPPDPCCPPWCWRGWV